MMHVSTSQLLLHIFHQCMHMAARGKFHINHNAGSFPPSQGRILQELSHNDGMGQKELAQRLGIRQPSLTELLIKLERSGHIERRRNEEDKRVAHIFLTPASHELIQGITEARQKMADDMFTALSEAEQATLITLLEKLLTAWERKEEQPPHYSSQPHHQDE